MEYFQPTSSDLRISRIGFGCAAVSGHDYGKVDRNQAISAIRKAWDEGVNLFDTADVYGFGYTEKILADALGTERHQAIITTKFGVNWDESARTYKDCSVRRMTEALEDSLRRLQLDCIPIYLVHQYDGITPLSDLMSALKECQKQGKIRYIGCSNFYLTVNCIMRNLINTRNEINLDCVDSEKISINDVLIKALGSALKEVPEANCSWQEDHIVMYGNIDISVAIAVEGGLYTPVIKNADNLGIREISDLMKDFVNRAKENTLSPDEYEGGNFTLSNLGMHGVDNFSAIINPPQAGILAIGSIRKMPLMVDDNIINSDVMSCQLSGDHRVLDGTIGAKLLHFFRLYVEHPSKMLL